MKIEIGELRRILTRSADINEELKTIFNNINTTLNEICANVKSDGLNEVNVEFTNYVAEVASELTTNLEVITTFLNTQVEAYSTQNVSTETDLSQTTTMLDNIEV